MLSLEVAVQAALIAGFVSVLVTWLNNRFQRQSKEDEHKRKRREWFLEKQAEDAEEIIATLEYHLKKLAEQLSVQDDLLFKGYLLIEERSLPSETEIREQSGTASKLFKEVGAEQVTRSAWFAYDSLRLTAWLDKSSHLKARLRALEKQFAEVYYALRSATYSLDKAFDELDQQQYEDSLQSYEEAHELSKKNRGTWSDLVSNAESFQQELIDTLREG